MQDLKIINTDLRNVDNSHITYSNNQENGLPILSWFVNKNARKLAKILQLFNYFLEVIALREIIASKIKQLIGNGQNQRKKDLV